VLDRKGLKKIKEKDDVIGEIVLSLGGKIGGGEEGLIVEEGEAMKEGWIVEDKSDAVKRRPVR
jgi:hypothetical protein